LGKRLANDPHWLSESRIQRDESPNPNADYFTRSDAFEQMAEGLATMEIERGHTSSVDCASNAQDDEEGDAEQGEHRAQAEEGSVRNMTGEVPATGEEQDERCDCAGQDAERQSPQHVREADPEANQCQGAFQFLGPLGLARLFTAVGHVTRHCARILVITRLITETRPTR